MYAERSDASGIAHVARTRASARSAAAGFTTSEAEVVRLGPAGLRAAWAARPEAAVGGGAAAATRRLRRGRRRVGRDAAIGR